MGRASHFRVNRVSFRGKEIEIKKQNDIVRKNTKDDYKLDT
jgi:hypothetical protein